MQNLINWISTNKIVSLIIAILILAVFLLGSGQNMMYNNSVTSVMPTPEYDTYSTGMIASDAPMQKDASTLRMPQYYSESVDSSVAPVDRKVVEESSLSLQVKNVSDTIDAIKDNAKKSGGFMVSSNLYTPMESTSGQIIVRIPSDKADSFLAFLRTSAVKVVSENMLGTDVTDQYVDNDAKLAVLNSTKAKFEKIMENATTIQDILNVQQQIINLQYQIDAVTGAQKQLAQTSNSTRISIYLSTDEYSLPYAPDNNWRPEVVFKTAVRALVQSFRGLANNLIWIGVYAVIWLPLLLLAIFLYRKFLRRTV